jgi:hypothetical protein
MPLGCLSAGFTAAVRCARFDTCAAGPRARGARRTLTAIGVAAAGRSGRDANELRLQRGVGKSGGGDRR